MNPHLSCQTFWANRYSTISGGNNNIASGVDAFVAGEHGRANYTDSAVLAFDGGDEACVSQGNKTVTICASNGLFLNGVKLEDAIEASVKLRYEVGVVRTRAVVRFAMEGMMRG